MLGLLQLMGEHAMHVPIVLYKIQLSVVHQQCGLNLQLNQDMFPFLDAQLDA